MIIMGDWYSWNITYQNKKPVRITVRDALGTHEVQPGSAKWNAILAEANQSTRKSKATSKIQRRKIWGQLNFNEKRTKLLVSLGVALFIFLLPLCIYPSYFGLHTREGYCGLFLTALLFSFGIDVSIFGIFCWRVKEYKWYTKIGFTILGITSLFLIIRGVTAYIKDFVDNDVVTYEGSFTLDTIVYRRSFTNYVITWEGDTLSSSPEHLISYAHYLELEHYNKVRITYWRNSGLVWSVEPLGEWHEVEGKNWWEW